METVTTQYYGLDADALQLFGIYSQSTAWSSVSTWDDELLATYDYDPEAAKELLAEAGYPDGLTITATIRSQDQSDMVVVQSDLAQIGIDLQLNVVEAGVWTSMRNAGNVQCQWMGWFPLYADADNNIYSYFYSTNAAGKSVFYNNPEFDALMDQARQITDDSERQKLYEQADEILSREDYASIPLYYPTYIYAAQSYVTGAPVGNLIYQLWYEVDFDMSLYNQ
jgi:peptide/nickel transport system substrate-binding protein